MKRNQRHASLALGVLALGGLTLGGCHRADVSADVHNTTPQPLFVEIYVKGNFGREATLEASRRLGPGDRALVGPVRQVGFPPGAFVRMDTRPNPSLPLELELNEGTNFLRVRQEGDGTAGRLMADEKR